MENSNQSTSTDQLIETEPTPPNRWGTRKIKRHKKYGLKAKNDIVKDVVARVEKRVDTSHQSIFYALISGMAAQGVLLPERIVEDAKKLSVPPDQRVTQLCTHIYGLSKVFKKKLDEGKA